MKNHLRELVKKRPLNVLISLAKGLICLAMEMKIRQDMRFLDIGIKPKVGDMVRVAVGSNTYLHEGIVSSIHEDYCWIDQFTKDGKYLRSFTASFSYAIFYYVK